MIAAKTRLASPALLASALFLLAFVGLPAAARAAAPAPGWTIESLAQPTNMESTAEVQQATVDAGGGSFSLSFEGNATGATGSGATTSGSATVTAVATATGTGTLTAGSPSITFASATSGAFLAGQGISGAGIPAATKITTVKVLIGSVVTLTLSADATAAGSGVALVAGPQPLLAGEEISGAGIPAGTKIDAVDAAADTLTLSEPATATAAGVALTANLPYDASAATVEAALDELPTIGGVGGSVAVSGGPGDPTGAHPYTITFGGALGGQNVAQIAATDLSLSSGTPSTAITTATITNGVAGNNRYTLLIRNAGSVASSSSATVTDTLPPGLHATAIKGRNTHGGIGNTISCTLATVTCTIPGAAEPLGMYEVAVEVAVEASLPETVVNSATISGGGALTATTEAPPNQLNEPDALVFGSPYLNFRPAGLDGAPDAQAGDHPYQLTVSTALNTESESGAGFLPVEYVKDVVAELPLGFVGDPRGLPTCPEAEIAGAGGALTNGVITTCPPGSAIGYIAIDQTTRQFGDSLSPGSGLTLIYNVTPEHGYPAEFGLNYLGNAAFLYPSVVRTPSGYALRVAASDIPRAITVNALQLTFFGNPPLKDGTANPGSPFFRDPTACSATPPEATIRFDSWNNPAAVPTNPDGSPDFNAADFSEPQWQSVSSPLPKISGCGQLTGFHPSFGFQPESSEAAAPSGYTADLRSPQGEGMTNPTTLATPDLRRSVVTLPEGVAVNPSAADGLGACGKAQIELQGGEPPTCPESSKVGTLEVQTPLLENPLPGSIYVARQDENPFHSLLALYLVVDDPATGVVLKLPGEVKPDPTTGQLTATFDENPQLPFEDLKLQFKGGPRAPLANPATCGTYKTSGEMTPWSAPESGPPAITEDEFAINKSAGESGCLASSAELPFAPSFEAGTASTTAGSYTPLVLKVHREAGEAALRKIEFTLPPGLTGRLAGIPYCTAAGIKAAEAKTGTEEQDNPSCPAGSQIGTVQTGAGVGSTPIYVPGKVYLAGPYEGAPLSTVVITPAVAGPFDLGDVVVRAPLYVNPETTQLTAKTDQIPDILQGIPLQIRSVEVNVNRKDFTLNPTSCEKMSVTGTLTGVAGEASDSENASAPFQVGGCNNLPFSPKLAISLKGATKRAGTPALTATLTQPEGQANTASAAVTLPHGEFLDQAHINTVCTRVQFAEGAGNGSACPAGSIYGHAEAWTPLLSEPLQGNVYLRSSSHKLPDLVAALKGPESQPIEVDLDGKVDSVHGAIRNSFEVVPDAAVSKFVLEMQGGDKSLLENSENICKASVAKRRATVRLIGQNGKRADQFPVVANSCAKHKKAKRHHKSSHRRQQLSQLLAAW